MAGIKDTDRGAKSLLAALKKMSEPAVLTVGIHPSANGQGRNGTPVLEYAGYNEFGTPTIQPRSFLRGWYDESQGKIKELLVKAAQETVTKRRTWEQSLMRLGLVFVGQIQDRISSSIPPENKPSTVDRKGSSTTLIDTGALRSSVSFEVKRGA